MISTLRRRVWSELGNPAQFADCPLWVVDDHSTSEPTLPRRGRDSVVGSTQKIFTAMALGEHTIAIISTAVRASWGRISLRSRPCARTNTLADSIWQACVPYGSFADISAINRDVCLEPKADINCLHDVAPAEQEILRAMRGAMRH